jgi:hypothetical protein
MTRANFPQIATSAACAALAAFNAVSAAAPSPPASAPTASAAAASAPRMGPGMPMNRDNTPGWSMMTPQERDAHQRKMMATTDAVQCRATMSEHHAQMAARAKQLGQPMPPQPRNDPCAGMKR